MILLRFGKDISASMMKQGHHVTLLSGALHFMACGMVAAITGTWLIWLAIGVPAVLFPAWIALRYPETVLARLAIAASLMIFTALIIQQSGGDIEAHFSFFVMTSILVVYCDWRPLVFAFLLIISHHLALTILQHYGSGLYIWADARGGWTHLAVHAIAGGIQTIALCCLAIMLRKRVELERDNAALGSSLRRAREQANRDPLTGLFNRRHLDALIKQLPPAKADAPERTIICAIDIDHFKRVNDRFGHSAGDDVLRAVTETISALIRSDDCAVRYGGEEFVLILPKLNFEAAEAIAERIRECVAAQIISTLPGPVSVTVSIGITTWNLDEKFDDAFQRADQALYTAKDKGRNRLEIGLETGSKSLEKIVA